MSHNIAVIGLGYVGLPLAVSLAKTYKVVGFDTNEVRIKELLKSYDRTNEVPKSELDNSTLSLSSNPEDIKTCSFYIITVPTPITEDMTPDLGPLENASKMLAPLLKKGDIVVYESTVYPGVTEDFCGPILNKGSGLTHGKDFFLGYSPERVSPGDSKRTLRDITKVVSAQTPEVTEILKKVYGSVNNNNIYAAKTIKVAEAAKVIENTQRDINIAFVNELSTLFSSSGISIYDVLDAAATKWNFLHFQPGLVGGHCIGVDPYYLAHYAHKNGHTASVTLAGRQTNESMPFHIANDIDKKLNDLPYGEKRRCLMLGITFKENVPDTRNSKTFSLFKELVQRGYVVDVYDPVADAPDVKENFKIPLLTSIEEITGPYHCAIAAVPHTEFTNIEALLNTLLCKDGIVYDIKRMLISKYIDKQYKYFCL